jgi:uncharacterized protein (TIGR02757 family)
MARHEPLKPESARALAPLLGALAQGVAQHERIGFDPVEFPHRYSAARDIEVAALLSASLAYGRVDLFKPKLEVLLNSMGVSPAEFVEALDVRGAAKLLGRFVYRFNVGTDVAVLLMGMGAALREHGGLEPMFAAGLARHGELRAALAHFTKALRDLAPLEALSRVMGPARGLDHLLPAKLGPGAAKRLMLFLRWMVRGPDRVDFGLWKSLTPSALVIPLDTHIGRLAHHLGLTRRTDLTWKTAQEITAALRLIDGDDPVRFDFALCHHGMSGQCPANSNAGHCAVCALRPGCRVGRRRVNRVGQKGR